MTSVLVVDDRPENRDLLANLLRYRDYRVTEAGDGPAALALVRKDPPDLIISDILMPQMDGYQFVRQMREDPKLARLPVIFNSAHFLGRESRALAKKLGVEHVLSKPNEPENVYAMVDLALAGMATQPPPVDDADLDREHLLVLTSGLRRKSDELRSAHQRLSELLAFARDISGETDIKRAIDLACASARRLIGAQFALATFDRRGSAETGDHFGVAGFEGDQAAALATFPQRSGRFAEFYEGCPFLRLSGLAGDPVAYGLPAALPRVSSLLAVPLHVAGRPAGWLCLAEKLGLDAFDGADTEIASAIANLLGRVLTCITIADDLRRRTRDLEAEMGNRLATEAALRQSERRLRDLAEGVSDWIWEIGPDLTFSYISGGTRADAVVDRRKFIGRTREAGSAEPTDTPAWQRHREDLEARRPFRDFVYKIFGPAGDLRSARISGQPLFDESGTFRGYHGVAVDITAQIALDERHAAFERRVADAKRLESLGTFAGGIAHDVNNLLVPIMALGSQVLEDLAPGDKHREDLERIVDAGQAITDLVRQVLTFSRREQQSLHPLPIAGAVEKSARLLRATLPKSIELSVQADPATGMIEGDESAILQVLFNLCKNAGDAIGDRRGRIDVALTPVKVEGCNATSIVPPGNYARLTVRDNGCGMDRAIRERVFEPFFTTKGVNKGTGIGLSVVHGIVTNHKGAITVDSEPGRGTVFEVYFPRTD
jgi:signal transduction histidine kinase/CheY-like chemotaxis protein